MLVYQRVIQRKTYNNSQENDQKMTTMFSDFDHVNLPEMKHGCLENPRKTI